MRQRVRNQKTGDRPLVGVLIDGMTGFGRAVMRGVMRYANLQRQWIIHEELRHVSGIPVPYWPDCDGAIIAGAPREVFEHLQSRHRYVVTCSGSGNPELSPVVCLDDFAVGVMAAQHLLECRLTQFGFYGFESGSPLSCRRFGGFNSTVTSHGFTCSDAGVGWPTSVERQDHLQGPKIIAWLLSLPKPVGIMAVDDSAAHQLAGQCLRAKLSVPDQVAIIGVNNDDLLCDSAWPPLSSVECDYSRVGFIAGGLLERMLQGKPIVGDDRLTRLSPLGVVRRQSTDLLAIGDTNVVAAVRYIGEHACDPCSVGDVLRHVPVGRRWLERQFVRTIGRTPHDEIIRVRIDVAQRLLRQPALTMQQVADKCGFAAQPNFGRAFRAVTGTTPGAYRHAALRGA